MAPSFGTKNSPLKMAVDWSALALFLLFFESCRVRQEVVEGLAE
jgi:hypothetical protein